MIWVTGAGVVAADHAVVAHHPARAPRRARRTSSCPRRGACSSGRSRRSAVAGSRGRAGRSTRCRCSSISASKAFSNSSEPGRETFLGEAAVDLRGHLVHPELDDRDVGRRRLEDTGRCGAARSGAGPPGGPRSSSRKWTSIRSPLWPRSVAVAVEPPSPRYISASARTRLRRTRAALGFGELAPRVPAHPEHLVKDAPPFEGLGDARIVHRHLREYSTLSRCARGPDSRPG